MTTPHTPDGRTTREALPLSAMVGTPVSDLVAQAESIMRRHLPCLSTLRGPFALDANEDVSPEGRSAHEEALAVLRTNAERTRRSAHNPVAQLVARSVERHAAEQQWNLGSLDFRSRLTGYPTIVSAGLLPFALAPDEVLRDLEPNLGERLRSTITLIRGAVRRAVAGDLTATSRDLERVGLLLTSLRDLRQRWAYALGRSTLHLVDELVAAVGEARQMPRIEMRPPHLDREAFMREVLGVDRGWSEERTLIEEAVYRTADRLGHLSARGQGGPVKDTVHAICREAYARLRGPKPQTPAAQIREAPRIARLIAGNALYIRGDDRLQLPPTLLLISERLVNRGPGGAQELGPLQAAYVVTLVAHELAPGHHEHYLASRDVLGGWVDVLVCPTGLEGWGVLAERSVARLAGVDSTVGSLPLERAALFQLLRRLISTYLWMNEGKEASELTRRIGASLRPEDRGLVNEVARRGDWGPPQYGIGWLETSRALAAVERVWPGPAAHEHFIRAGPVLPSLASLLALGGSSET